MNPTKFLLFEACVETPEEAMTAESRGANRIELCSALEYDGLTPTEELTRLCVSRLSIPVMAMVRPRAGNFVYSEEEITQMINEIEQFKKMGVAGVVFGLLNQEGNIDLGNTRRLAKLAFPLEVTFHKAIDSSHDLLKSFHELNAITEVTRVLTSGGKYTAYHGKEIIRTMHEMPGRRIKIIAAGKITPENRLKIAELTGVTELHGKRIV
jgi:copper homeostasis protein